jgi:hypothetical protein
MVDLLTQSKGDAIIGGEITARVIIRPLIGAPQASRRAGRPRSCLAAPTLSPRFEAYRSSDFVVEAATQALAQCPPVVEQDTFGMQPPSKPNWHWQSAYWRLVVRPISADAGAAARPANARTVKTETVCDKRIIATPTLGLTRYPNPHRQVRRDCDAMAPPSGNAAPNLMTLKLIFS